MAQNKTLTAKFWGVRGSIASPMNEDGFLRTVESLADEHVGDSLRCFVDKLKDKKGTLVHGGNTSCVEVVAHHSNQRFVLDMGTGLMSLGNSLMKKMFENKGLQITFLLSHVHWDHIQGLPFFGPLYMNKELGINNFWHFLGGTDWQRRSEVCIAGQMDPPNFPVSWKEIIAMTTHIQFSDVMDHFSRQIGSVKVTSRKLHHPQETYGYRLEQAGKVIVYATDNEPFDPLHPHPALTQLAKDADLLIIDCQYSDRMYHGSPPPNRYGWGHSYPTAVAHVIKEARPKNVALFHHDPGASRLDILARVDETKAVLGELKYTDCNVFSAWEGLEFSV